MSCRFGGEGGGWGAGGWGEFQWGEGEDSTVFRGSLLDLLPPGPAWTREVGTWMYKVTESLSIELGRVAQSACDLFKEALPTTANHLLDEHLENAGLPDDDCPLPASIEARRAALHSVWTSRASPNKSVLTEIAENLGYTGVSILSPIGRPFRSGFGRSGTPLRPQESTFHWEMTATRPAHLTDDVLLTCSLERIDHEHITFSLNIS